MSRTKYSRYCEYAYSCDKNINCKDGDFCSAFEHTTEFSSLHFDEEDSSSGSINLFDKLLEEEE